VFERELVLCLEDARERVEAWRPKYKK